MLFSTAFQNGQRKLSGYVSGCDHRGGRFFFGQRRRQHPIDAARWLGVPMNVIGKECLHDCEAGLSAAL
jgi:hypothetical protein